MADHDNVGTGRWNYSYHGPKDSALQSDPKPALAEPLFRVGPPSVSSGLSFRSLPPPTFGALLDICSHYEAKLSGKYSSTSPAARYVFSMSRELQGVLAAMSAASSGPGQRVRDLEALLKEWNDCFGSNSGAGRAASAAMQGVRNAEGSNNNSSNNAGGAQALVSPSSPSKSVSGGASTSDAGQRRDYSTQGVFGLVPMTPSAVRHLLERQATVVERLTRQVCALHDSTNRKEQEVRELLMGEVQAARDEAAADRASHQRVIAEVSRAAEEDVKAAREEAADSRDEAARVVDYDRKRAEILVKDILTKERGEKANLQRNFDELTARLDREWTSKLRHLEVALKTAVEDKRSAVAKAEATLNKQHALQLAAVARQASAAAMSGGGAGAAAQASTTATQPQPAFNNQTPITAGGKRLSKAQRRREEDAKKAASPPGQVGTVAISTNAWGAVGGCGASGGSDAPPPSFELLRSLSEEASWLRSRVAALEEVVSAQRRALEEGAGPGISAEFEGWREIVAVKYPWMHGGRPENPERYTYLAGVKDGRRKDEGKENGGDRGNAKAAEKKRGDADALFVKVRNAKEVEPGHFARGKGMLGSSSM